MDLREFVAQTLAQIAEGVALASAQVAETGGTVNPKVWGGDGTYEGSPILPVEFTVALSVNEGTATKGGIGVVAGAFALGAQGQSTNTQASTTHVKFSVPMALPLPKEISRSPQT